MKRDTLSVLITCFSPVDKVLKLQKSGISTQWEFLFWTDILNHHTEHLSQNHPINVIHLRPNKFHLENLLYVFKVLLQIWPPNSLFLLKSWFWGYFLTKKLCSFCGINLTFLLQKFFVCLPMVQYLETMLCEVILNRLQT